MPTPATKPIEDFESLIELIEYFDSEQKCIEYFEFQRWQGKCVCPRCECDKVYKYKNGRTYKCSGCKQQFTVKIGTIFEDSKISLKKWFVAMYLVLNHKKGISSYTLARDLKVQQRTAWFMLHRIRFGLGLDNNINDVSMSGVVECDETFVGGKNKNRHKDKKVEMSTGRAFKDKTPILGVLNRGGKVVTVVVPNTTTSTIQPLVRQMVKGGTIVITDEWGAYRGLGDIYEHYVVNHGAGQYGDGFINTNSIEGFWAWIKRMIVGTYHKTSRKHLQQYANEATFRYNTRDLTLSGRIRLALSLTGVRLKYKQLTQAA